jgi:hypothetical protein
MQKLVTGSFLAAVAMFIFGAIYWTSPMSGLGIHDVADDLVAQAILAETFPETGVYWVPGMSLYAENPEQFETLHITGPVAMVNIVHSPGAPMAPATFVYGFLHNLVACLLIGLLLSKAAPALATYGARVGFVLLAGVTTAFFVEIASVIWWRMPLLNQLVSALYDVLAWLLAGLILARFVVAPGSKTA